MRHPNPPFVEAAAKMPVLRHFQPGQPFDIMKSNVVDYLVTLPEIRQEVFNLCKRSGAIVYNDGLWRGANWKAP
jgi:hypothetical protein